MKTINFLRITIVSTLTALAFSCSKDDDNIPAEPQTGYFAKTIEVVAEGNIFYDITLKYDHNNRLIGETYVDDDGDSTEFIYGYNERGQMTEYKEKGNLLYHFVYEDNIIVKRIEYDIETEEMIEELPVSFSGGTYSMNGEDIAKIDAQNQLLEIPYLNVVFSYEGENGVHRHLALSPARYFTGERDIEFVLYDLALSNKAFKGWTQEDRILSVKNTRNEEGLIIKAVGNWKASEEEAIIWRIDYEERELVD